MFHDVTRHRGEVVPRLLLSTFLKKISAIFPFVQALVILLDCHNCANMMESGLATAPANSLMALLGAID